MKYHGQGGYWNSHGMRMSCLSKTANSHMPWVPSVAAKRSKSRMFFLQRFWASEQSEHCADCWWQSGPQSLTYFLKALEARGLQYWWSITFQNVLVPFQACYHYHSILKASLRCHEPTFQIHIVSQSSYLICFWNVADPDAVERKKLGKYYWTGDESSVFYPPETSWDCGYLLG